MSEQVREYLATVQPQLVLSGDIAARLGQRVGTVLQWTHRPGFPSPVLVVGHQSPIRVWLWDEVVAWYAAWKG